MNSKLVLLCIFAYLSTNAHARPQQWQRPDFSNPFFPNNPTSTPAAPASPTTVPSQRYLACLSACPSTMEYNPVCGSDSQNYHNNARLECAVRCGQAVTFVRMGTCSAL